LEFYENIPQLFFFHERHYFGGYVERSLLDNLTAHVSAGHDVIVAQLGLDLAGRQRCTSPSTIRSSVAIALATTRCLACAIRALAFSS
jgi:hypothetical protein